jgi:cytidine deaminase
MYIVVWPGKIENLECLLKVCAEIAIYKSWNKFSNVNFFKTKVEVTSQSQKKIWQPCPDVCVLALHEILGAKWSYL